MSASSNWWEDVVEWLSVDDAAASLSVSPQQVRRLLAQRELVGRRHGRAWMIDSAQVRQRQEFAVRPGRPLSAEMAWELLHLISAVAGKQLDGLHEGRRSAHAAQESAAQALDVRVAALGDRRVRHRLRRLAGSAPPVAMWPSWMGRRAEGSPVRVHPGLLGRLAQDERVSLSGPVVASQAGAGFGAELADSPSLYVVRADVDGLVARYKLASSTEAANVILRVLPDALSLALRPVPGRPCPAGPALLDCLQASDVRQRHAARELLEGARATLIAAGLADRSVQLAQSS